MSSPSQLSAQPPSPARSTALTDIRSESRETLASRFGGPGIPSYRLDQLLAWLYPHRVEKWDEMTNLPRKLREELAQHFGLELPQLIQKQGSHDSTQKFLWRLGDGNLVESVLIPANPDLYGERADRHTLCVSTQVGCAYGCRFCASGLDGWRRNLGPHEIIGQVLAVERWNSRSSGKPDDAQAPAQTPPATSERLVNNLVIMGMGEPLANYDNLMQALRTLNAPWGGAIGARKITISTSGLAPRIRDLADDPLQFRLAISLHGATDEVRDRIMPVNRKYPLAVLTEAGMYYVEKKGKMITLEYILIAGVNDSLDEVLPLSRLAHKLHAKVNLIPYNQVEGLSWTRPEESHCRRFSERLQAEGITATLRIEKGHDIEAACGQLRLKSERLTPLKAT